MQKGTSYNADTVISVPNKKKKIQHKPVTEELIEHYDSMHCKEILIDLAQTFFKRGASTKIRHERYSLIIHEIQHGRYSNKDDFFHKVMYENLNHCKKIKDKLDDYMLTKGDLCKELLLIGADPFIKDNDGFTSLNVIPTVEKEEVLDTVKFKLKEIKIKKILILLLQSNYKNQKMSLEAKLLADEQKVSTMKKIDSIYKSLKSQLQQRVYKNNTAFFLKVLGHAGLSGALKKIGYSKKDVVEELISIGANPNKKFNGLSAFDCVLENERDELMPLLKNAKKSEHNLFFDESWLLDDSESSDMFRDFVDDEDFQETARAIVNKPQNELIDTFINEDK